MLNAKYLGLEMSQNAKIHADKFARINNCKSECLQDHSI